MATEAEIKTIVSANIADFEAKMRKAVDKMQSAEKSFARSNKRVESSFGDLARGVKAFVGALVVREVIQFGNSLLKMAGDLKDVADQTGIAAETLSALSIGLQTNGSSIDEFASSVARMNNNLEDAATGGNKKLVESLDRIGLSIGDLAKLAPEEQFFKIAEALGKVEDQGALTAIGVDIFGKSFIKLLPILKETNGNIEEYVDKLRDAGQSLSQEQIDTLDEFGKSIERLGVSAKNAAAGGLADFIKFMKEYNSNNAGFDAIYNPVIESKVNAAMKNRQKAMDDYLAKAKAAGFATSVTRGDLSSDLSGAFGVPNKPASAPKASGGKPAPIQSIQSDYKKVEKAVEQVNTKNQEMIDKMLEQQRLADELGGTFRDAFADGVLGANKFGDVLGALGKRLAQIFFNKAVGDPISKGFSGLLDKVLGGAGGGLGSFFPTFSFATGTQSVPYDTVAMLHKGEQVLTRQQADAMQSGGYVKSAGNIYNIDARGADAGAIARIERSLIALAGNGVVERRVLNAQTRGEL